MDFSTFINFSFFWSNAEVAPAVLLKNQKIGFIFKTIGIIFAMLALAWGDAGICSIL